MGNEVEFKMELSSKFEYCILKPIYFYFLVKCDH